MMRFHTQTGGSTLTAQQPENNVVRVTLQALAAVLGGTQSLHTNSMDEALWLPTEEAVMVALRTQQIIAHETGVADSIDPLAGSYLVEYLTDEVEARAREYIEKIDQLGGSLLAIERGYIQGEIQNAAYQAQCSFEEGVDVVVGVNAYQVEEAHHLVRLHFDPAIEVAARDRLAALREQRDPEKVSGALTQLEIAARGSENLVPLLINCVEKDVTLGEICGMLRQVWGEYEPPAWM
jgi:methylmalonyl-CoA mutase N-terminal domain/subunit